MEEASSVSDTHTWTREREAKLRSFFGLSEDVELTPHVNEPELSDAGRSAFEHYGFDWYAIPAEEVQPFDDAYLQRCYPSAGSTFQAPHRHAASVYDSLLVGHRQHMGRFVAVERTQKPGYLPGNQQFYGTAYGFQAAADPLVIYMGRAGFTTRTRFNHNYESLRKLIALIQTDWSAAGWLPHGYRVSICPPAIFNLVGSVFHLEWSETASLELGFYADSHGNAQCFAVGPNGRGDLSFVHEVETESEWPMLGFRLALVPDLTAR
jgi:hypothetical protein